MPLRVVSHRVRGEGKGGNKGTGRVKVGETFQQTTSLPADPLPPRSHYLLASLLTQKLAPSNLLGQNFIFMHIFLLPEQNKYPVACVDVC